MPHRTREPEAGDHDIGANAAIRHPTDCGVALTGGFELRQETLTRFEERATRLPVLLMLPMVLFILPCFFVIVGGPAVIRVMQALSH